MPAPGRTRGPLTAPPGRMDPLVVGARQNGIQLDAPQISQFEVYRHEMLTWNSKASLTSVTAPGEILTRHFVDSLSIVACLPDGSLGPGTTIIDVGSGAGLPGVPLKIAHPAVTLVLLEANGKKAAFLESLVRVLDLEGVRVVRGRAEDAGRSEDLREAFDIVVSRAVAPMEVLVELTLPFSRVGGVTIAQKGEEVSDELGRAARAISLLGGGDTRTHRVTPPGSPVGRSLVVTQKVRATPDRFPRRPGIPAKRPL